MKDSNGNKDIMSNINTNVFNRANNIRLIAAKLSVIIVIVDIQYSFLLLRNKYKVSAYDI